MTTTDTCRFCYEPGIPHNPLESPCDCKGSMAFIHTSCLIQWMRQGPSSQFCTICNGRYKPLEDFTEEVLYQPGRIRMLLLENASVPFLFGLTLYAIDLIRRSEPVLQNLYLMVPVFLLFTATLQALLLIPVLNAVLDRRRYWGLLRSSRHLCGDYRIPPFVYLILLICGFILSCYQESLGTVTTLYILSQGYRIHCDSIRKMNQR